MAELFPDVNALNRHREDHVKALLHCSMTMRSSVLLSAEIGRRNAVAELLKGPWPSCIFPLLYL